MNRIAYSDNVKSFIENTMASQEGITRSKLTTLVCNEFNWYSAFGKPRKVECTTLLNKMEDKEIIQLPKKQFRAMKGTRKQEFEFSLVNVECSLEELGPIEIILAKNNKCKLWNYLVEKYHYLHNSKLVGTQIRYLIKSPKYGYLGALSFNSSSFKLERRDLLLGITNQNRADMLNRIICNSRTLILPGIKINNLISHIFKLVFQRLSADWENLTGIKPVMVETFVDKAHYLGTCYKASNWINIGQTKGRGRNDQYNKYEKSIKDIYLYPLDRKYNDKLIKALDKEVKKRKQENWAKKELKTLSFGNKRIEDRCCNMLEKLYEKPCSSLMEVFKGSKAAIKGSYRLINNERVQMKSILNAHYDSTCERINEHTGKYILCVQDTSEIDYSTLDDAEGLGYLHKSTKGLLLHDTMAFTENGTPLGLLDAQVWARKDEDFGKKHKRQQLPIEKKESMKWLNSFNACEKYHDRCSSKTFINIGDRESDLYELFAEKHNSNAKTELLVRCEKTRKRNTSDGYVWDVLPKEKEMFRMNVHVPKSGVRIARDAVVSVRVKRVELIPPIGKKNLPSIEATCIYVSEITKASDKISKPLEWMLITTINVQSKKEIQFMIQCYVLRWCIEIYHKTLKSGCLVEKRQFHSAENLMKMLALDMIVAFRIYHLTKLGRETPDVSCTVFFEEAEWQALLIENNKTIDKPPTINEMIIMIAQLGGYMNRKSDPPPGTKVIWKGLKHLNIMKNMYISVKNVLLSKKPHT